MLKHHSLAELLPAIADKLRKPIQRLSTGMALLDSFLTQESELSDQCGFVLPSLVVMGAEPKIGKSTWAQIIGENHILRNGITYYVDLENGLERFARKLIWRRSQANRDRINEALEWCMGDHGKRLIFDDGRELTPKKLGDRILPYRDSELLVVIDSLQKLPMDMRDRRGGIDFWLRHLERIRSRIGCVILVISELRRSNRSETGKYTTSGNVYKESGDIEYTADLALSLRRLANGLLRLRAEYNRDGVTGDISDYRPIYDYSSFKELRIKQ